ncbi:hypothetical protein QCA50_006374 [Cerrena zonata]|uniref:Uncharacterized protein n=1 Tax=Cerrena zonata TaxID=2478898 RepID=A0AAW0GF24_9APHY
MDSLQAVLVAENPAIVIGATREKAIEERAEYENRISLNRRPSFKGKAFDRLGKRVDTRTRNKEMRWDGPCVRTEQEEELEPSDSSNDSVRQSGVPEDDEPPLKGSFSLALVCNLRLESSGHRPTS